MSNELRCTYNGSGATLYAIVRRTSDNYVWNGTAFESWDDASIGDYDVALSDRGGDEYSADFPSSISAGTYRIGYYNQAGASPATTDTRLRTAMLYWNGTAASEPGDVSVDAYALTSLTSLKRHIRIDADDTSSDTLLAQIINQVSAYIEAVCGRKFLARDYRHWHNGEIQRRLLLPQWPVEYVARIAYGSANAMTVHYSGSAIRANATVTETGILLVTVSTSGVTTRNHLLFTDYPSLSLMETQIETINGWTATVHQNMPTADLHRTGGENALNLDVVFTYPDRDTSQYSVNYETGEVMFNRVGDLFIPVHDGFRQRPYGTGEWATPAYFPRQFQGIVIEYKAGYSSVPADVELVANELCNMKYFDGDTSPYLKSINLGSYSATFSDIDEQYVRQRLALYVSDRVLCGGA